MTLFGDYEKVKYDADHRYISTTPCNASTGPLCFDPSQAPVYTLNATGTPFRGRLQLELQRQERQLDRRLGRRLSR